MKLTRFLPHPIRAMRFKYIGSGERLNTRMHYLFIINAHTGLRDNEEIYFVLHNI